MKDFQDKVAVITGGASGIGFATAQALAKLGARLVLADIEDSVLKSAMNELSSAGAKVIEVRTDVGDGFCRSPRRKVLERIWPGRYPFQQRRRGGVRPDADHDTR